MECTLPAVTFDSHGGTLPPGVGRTMSAIPAKMEPVASVAISGAMPVKETTRPLNRPAPRPTATATTIARTPWPCAATSAQVTFESVTIAPIEKIDAVREDHERLTRRDEREGQSGVRDAKRLDRPEAPVLNEVDQEQHDHEHGRDEGAAQRDPSHVVSRTTANEAATTLLCETSSPSSIRAGTPSWKTATRSHRPTSSSVSDE